MSSCLIMTLEEMLRLALGTHPLQPIQISILHSFLRIVLQKADISTCFTKVSGPETRYLERMLNNSYNPCVHIEACPKDDLSADSNINIFQMEDEIKRLTEKVNQMETKLKNHLDCIEHCRLQSNLKRKLCCPENLEEGKSDSSDCEEFCLPCDEKSLLACDFLQNEVFLRKLLRRITKPCINQLLRFEKMFDTLKEKFEAFQKISDRDYPKIVTVEDLIREIKKFKRRMENHNKDTRSNIIDLQEIMDTKLDKMHVPRLKKTINERLMELENKLIEYAKTITCPKAAGVVMESRQCLCCLTKVCQKEKTIPFPLVADFTPKKVPLTECYDDSEIYCVPREGYRSCGGRNTVIQLEEKALRRINLMDIYGDPTKQLDPLRKIVYLKGHHGRLYRQGPKFDSDK